MKTHNANTINARIFSKFVRDGAVARSNEPIGKLLSEVFKNFEIIENNKLSVLEKIQSSDTSAFAYEDRRSSALKKLH